MTQLEQIKDKMQFDETITPYNIAWLVSQLEKAIEMAEYYAEQVKDPRTYIPRDIPPTSEKAREFLEQMKCL